jgi:predicted membrane channel-forming protein YqfA (hemolysin III family)
MLALAIVLVVAAVGYFVVTTFVDLYPFNNVRGARRSEQVKEVSVNAPIMAVPAVLLGSAAVFSLPALGYAAGVIELLVAVAGLLLWWMPYLTGRTVPWATAGTRISWSELHTRTYAQTVIVMPYIGDRPRPNLEHMILHGLILSAAICTFLASASL